MSADSDPTDFEGRENETDTTNLEVTQTYDLHHIRLTLCRRLSG